MRSKMVAAASVLIPAVALYAIGWISGNAAQEWQLVNSAQAAGGVVKSHGRSARR